MPRTRADQPMPPVRNTYTGLTGTNCHCEDCGWESYARNGLGQANQHARRTGHTVHIEQIVSITYNRKG